MTKTRVAKEASTIPAKAAPAIVPWNLPADKMIKERFKIVFLDLNGQRTVYVD
jgi:hypothetical protein